MFARKKRPVAQPRLKIWSGSGEMLFDGRLTGLELPDAIIKALSLRFFNDPEPCEIHRSAVMSRVFAELEGALKDCAVAEIEGLDIPSDYFSAYPDARRVQLIAG